jgi:putative Mg2+ transporter-C (MgtC) family protein
MLSNTDILLRLLTAAALGGLVGFDRERLLWAAGLRTHMLVSVGSALLMIVSAYGFSDVVGREGIGLDPSRVAAQVVSGIGFLGAGTILLKGNAIRGLTTAASLWAVAAVGLASGSGMYGAAVGTTLLLLLILAGLKPIEARYHARAERHIVRVQGGRGTLSLGAVRGAVGVVPGQIRQLSVGEHEGGDLVTVTLNSQADGDLDAISDRLRAMPGVRTVEIHLHAEDGS